MKRLLLAAMVALCLPASAQTPLAPINAPVFRALDSNGLPLVGGLLWSYQAGTTTPQATYTSASGATPNTNPVVLDSTGSAQVFLGNALTYKFVLQNSLGVQQWTVDQISGAINQTILSFNGRTGAVVPASGDYGCAMVTGALCTSATAYYQTVQVAGTAVPQEAHLNFVAAGGIGAFTITAGGTLYTTAPGVTFSGGGCVTAPTGSTVVASGAVTKGVILTSGSGCTSAPTPVFSGGGGSGAAGTTALVTVAITCNDDPTNTSTDCSLIIPATGITVTQTDVTSSRVFGTTYQNTSGLRLNVSGYGTISGGSGDSKITCADGPSSPSITVWSNTTTATGSGEPAGFACLIPPGYYYSVAVTNIISSSPGKWLESSF